MTISRDIWNRGVELLIEADRYKRAAPSPEFAAVYIETLASLDDNAFIACVKLWIRDHDRFPTPAELLSIVRPSPNIEQEAGEILTRILAEPVYSPNGSRYDLATVNKYGGEAAMDAVQAIGGLPRLNRLLQSDDGLPFVLKEFSTAYGAARALCLNGLDLNKFGIPEPSRSFPAKDEAARMAARARLARHIAILNEGRARLLLPPVSLETIERKAREREQ